MSDDYKKNIGYVGTISLLVSSITGPGVLTVPNIWQQGGWLYPLLFHIFITVMSGLGGLFLLESIAKFPNNNEFTENVEMTVLVHQFYGRRWHIVMQILMYGAMQSTNVASIVLTAQAFDNLFIAFGATCGIALAPIEGIICVYNLSASSSIFGDDQYMLMTLGFLVMLLFTIPLAMVDLADNMIVQFVSFVSMILITLTWFIAFCTAGLKNFPLPAIGSSTSQIVGNLLFNYAFATTVPSWLNGKHKSVPTKKSIWTSLIIATTLYLIIGLFGAVSFDWSSGGTILSTLSASAQSSGDTSLNLFMFPLTCLVTSIPVYIIISRQNLVQANVCSKSWANFWAFGFPLIISIPLQNGSFVNTLTNWTSLIFTSTVNFIAPFLIHYFAEHRNTVLSESIMSELSFGDDDVKSIQRASGPDPYDGYHLKLDTIEVTKKSKWTGAKFRLRSQLANRLKSAVSAATNGTSKSSKPSTENIAGISEDQQTYKFGDIRESAILSESYDNQQQQQQQQLQHQQSLIHNMNSNNMTEAEQQQQQQQQQQQNGVTTPPKDHALLSPLSSSSVSNAPPPSGIPVARTRLNKFTMHDIATSAMSQLLKSNRVAPANAPETTDLYSNPSIYPATSAEVATTLNATNEHAGKEQQGASSLRSRSIASSYTEKGRDKTQDEYAEAVNDKYDEFKALPDWITNRIPAKYISLACGVIMTGMTILVLVLQGIASAVGQ